MTLKKTLSLALALISILALAACGGTPAATTAPPATNAPETDAPASVEPSEQPVDLPTISLRMGNTYASGSASVNNDELTKAFDKIAERTNGGITCEIFGDSLLGNEADMLEALHMKSLDMMLLSPGFLSTIHPELIVEDLPYMFKTREDGYAALDGDYGAKIEEIIAEPGEIRSLGFLELGYRHMTNNVRPLNTPEDLAGLKFRTTSSDLRRAVFETLGATVISMGFNELFMALQQNVVDGQETPLTTINSSSLYEAQKYLSLTGHFWTNNCILINEEVWQSIPAEWQTIVMEEMEVCVANVRERMQQEDVDMIAVLEDKGMEINEVDKSLFVEALAPLYDKYEEEVIGKELMDLYRKYSGY